MADLHSLSTLLTSLSNPSSPEVLARGTSTLQALYTQPGFYNNLQQIALSSEVPRDTRVLAGLCLKNEMLGRWRGKTVMSDDEKALIRARLLAFLNEPDAAIAQVQFFILSKVSRLDFPRAWPDLLDQLLNPLVASATSRLASSPPSPSTSDRFVLRNCLWCLNRVVKEWSTVRLPIGTKVMGEFVPKLMPVLGPLLGALAELPREGMQVEDVESGLLCYKVISRLSVFEWSRPVSQRMPGAEERINHVFQITTSHLSILLAARTALVADLAHKRAYAPAEIDPSAGLMLKTLTKHVGALIKHLRRLEDANPKVFATIPGANEVVLQLWAKLKEVLGGRYTRAEDQESAEFPERFIILSLLILKDLLPIWAASHPEVLNNDLVSDVFTLITERMLILTPADLETLEHDPEEWVIAETAQNEQWTYNLRACGERLLMALNNACRNMPNCIQSLLGNKLQAHMSRPIQSEDDMIQKEAVFTAAGRLARSLVDNEQIPPAQFLAALAEEAKTSPHRVLKRRIAWLVGELVDAQEDLASGPLPWELLLGLLQERGDNSDVGVRLTACTALKQAMDLWEMEASCFKSYIPRITESLMHLLLEELELLDGKRRVLDALEVMIERVGTDIVPLLTQIAECVPQLWEKAANQEGEWLFKSSLLSLVTKMVDAAKTEANRLCPLCVGLLGESLQGNAKMHLEEDGLILWQSLVRNASVLEPQLIDLASVAIGQITSDPDSMGRSLAIVDSYALICGAELYQHFATQLANAFKSCFLTSTPTDFIDILTSLSLHITIVPISLWGPAFASAGLLSKLITDASQPNVGTALPHYASLFGRMILADANGFLELMRMEGVGKGAFLDLWWTAFDRIALSSIRKRVALASAALCATGDVEVLQRFSGEFVNLFLDVLGELKEQADDGEGGAKVDIKLLWKRGGADGVDLGDSEGTAEGTRRKTLYDADPVYTASLKDFLREKLAVTPDLGRFVDVADPAFVELQGYLASP